MGHRIDIQTINYDKMLTHGLTNTPIYLAWKGMKDRCKRNPHYIKNNIRYCKKWEDFNDFLRDMGSTYQDGLSLDRIRNHIGYRKSNCRWTTHDTQQRNKRNVILYNYNGKRMILADWAIELNIKYSTLRKRIKVHKWPIHQAFKLRPQLNNKIIRINLTKKKRC